MKPVQLATKLTIGAIALLGCSDSAPWQSQGARLIPAEEFSRSVKQGNAEQFSIFRVAEHAPGAAEGTLPAAAGSNGAGANTATVMTADARAALGAPEVGAQEGSSVPPGLKLRRSYGATEQTFVQDGDVAGAVAAQPVAAVGAPTNGFGRQLPRLPQLPPGSQSPYATGQMTTNPSLWPDEAQGATLFTDFRAFQAMDVITVLVNEANKGKKTTKSNSEGKYSLAAGIKAFLGIETKWKSNNDGLDPESLVNASTNQKFEGKGEMNREGAMTAKLSAVIMEILPNGLLRIEGTKIVSVDNEEEVMVISGLVRSRDIDSQNQIESNRVANMRIDFYGRGVLAEQQSPGWGARLFTQIWPF